MFVFLKEPLFQLVLAFAFGTGIVRGFSGFGTGLIMAPIVASFYGPTASLIILVVMDSWPAFIPAIKARKQARWSEILPMLVGFVMIVPLGVMFVKHGNPLVLRWFITLLILIVVPILWSGWHYRGPRNPLVSGAIGGLCGFLGGSVQIPGPPAIIYWMSSSLPKEVIRASILAMFVVTEFVSIAAYYMGGLFSWRLFLMGVSASPVFFAGIMLGSRIFHLASEQTYRRIAFILILISATTSLPVLDEWLR